jgi:hypothetical protein
VGDGGHILMEPHPLKNGLANRQGNRGSHSDPRGPKSEGDSKMIDSSVYPAQPFVAISGKTSCRVTGGCAPCGDCDPQGEVNPNTVARVISRYPVGATDCGIGRVMITSAKFARN